MLLKDDATQRNDWRLGRVVRVKMGEDQNVRSLVVQTSTLREYERPISKIVLLVEAEIIESPTRNQLKVNELYFTWYDSNIVFKFHMEQVNTCLNHLCGCVIGLD